MPEFSIDQLKKYYRREKSKSCIELFKGDLRQIVLIRHGEPDIKKEFWYTREKALHYSSTYDKVGVKEVIKNPICNNSLPVKRVYHSSIPRAVHTAELLFKDNAELISDARFREFEKSIPKFLYFPMPLKFWNVLSRMLWFAGINSDSVETIKEAKERVKGNARFLVEKSTSENIIILVAHGWHNRYLIRNLKRQRWEHVYKGGNTFLGVNILALNPNK